MTWVPTQTATDTGRMVANLIEYFKDHQTEALEWVNGGSGLTDIAYYYDTGAGAVDEIFNNGQFLNESDFTDYNDEGNVISYTVDYQMEIEHTLEAGEILAEQASVLRAQTKRYIKAHESMILNIPTATLMTGISNYTKPAVVKMAKNLGRLCGDAQRIMYRPIMRITWEFQEN